jgi:regulator of sirC expression with transglutaminase-like and TPR domain
MGEDAFRSSVARASRPHDLPLLERALKTFDQRLSTEPAHHEALRERGFTLALLDRHEEALDSFVAAASQRPEDAAVQLAAARSLAELKRTR